MESVALRGRTGEPVARWPRGTVQKIDLGCTYNQRSVTRTDYYERCYVLMVDESSLID